MGITESLITRLEARRKTGIRKYGKELTPDAYVDFLREAIDEALDLACYLEALRQKLEREGA